MINRNAIAREQARLLRMQGMSHTKIAGITGLTRGIINNIARGVGKVEENKTVVSRIQQGQACAYCGISMNQHDGPGRPRRFCSEHCRRQYWRLHRSEQLRRADKLYLRTCAYCGKTFQIYGKNDRKYCCREHYRLHFYVDSEHISAGTGANT